MKRLITLAATCCLLATPSFATTIVQNITLTESGADQSPFSATGVEFDPTLGYLNSVTATLTGSFHAMIITNGMAPASVMTSVKYYFDAFDLAHIVSNTTGSLNLVGSGNELTGSTSINVSGLTFQPSDFELSGTGPTNLFNFDVSAANVYETSDDSSLSGNLALTYTYNVPEPSSLALLGAGLLGIVMTKRRRGDA